MLFDRWRCRERARFAGVRGRTSTVLLFCFCFNDMFVVVLLQYELPLQSELRRKLQQVCLNISSEFVEPGGMLSHISELKILVYLFSFFSASFSYFFLTRACESSFVSLVDADGSVI